MPFRVQKKKHEKCTPLSRSAFSGTPCASRYCRDAGNSPPLAVQTCQRPYSSTSVMLSGTEWGPKNPKNKFFKIIGSAEQLNRFFTNIN
jgi:hypothetical protein